MAHLIVFDIDGTVCDTNDVDERCYVAAVSETFGLHRDQVDCSNAPHITDSAILEWVIKQRFGRDVTRSEIVMCQNRFVELLQIECHQSRELFSPIAGASDILKVVKATGWDVTFATGAWRRSAELKLRQIGLNPDDVVMVTADDAKTRQEIVTGAVETAQRRFRKTYSRVVSVGDGVWDVTTAASLGFPFVGVGVGERARRLRVAGAETVIPDFSDPTTFIRALEVADVPTQTFSLTSG